MRQHKSLRALARELGVSASYLSQVQHGKRPASDRLLSALDCLSVKQSVKQFSGAEGGTRTRMNQSSTDFKSVASAYSATSAG